MRAMKWLPFPAAWRLPAAAALGVLAASCAKPPPAPAAPTVAVARTIRTTLANTITLQGEFYPYQDILVHAEVSGYVSAIRVDLGDRVGEGELLATLEVPELKDQLAAAAATEQHDEAEHAIAHLDYARLAGVNRSQPNLIAQQDLDDAEAKDSATAATAAMARAEVARYQTLRDYTRITAPFAGVITRRFADVGALIQAGTSSGTTPLVELAEDDLLRLRFPVPEAESPLVHPGQPVQFSVDALHRTLTGRVVRDAWAIERYTRTMIAEVDVPNPGAAFQSGMYATIVLPLQSAADALAIPLQALNPAGRPTVLMVGPDGRIAERAVTVGLRTADLAEIRAGLDEGDLVVVGDRGSLQVGDPVTPRIVDSAPPL
jgi:RND family efflux transporter MFP subunit